MTSGEPQRILYFEGNPDGTVGGSYFSLLYLAEGVDRTRFQPIVAFRRDIPFLKRYREAGLDVRIVPGHRAQKWPWLHSAAVRRVALFLWALALVRSLVNLVVFYAVSVPRWAAFLRRNRIALVHANNSVTRSHDLMLGALLLRIPVVTHERGINERFSRLAAFCAKRLSAIICISDAVRQNLASHGIGAGNLHVIHNAVDAERVRPGRTADEVRATFGIAPTARVVVMLGNLRRWKGQEVVVRALALLVPRMRDLVCLFVGAATEEDRPFEEELRRLVSELGIEPNVRFTGYQENVADFLNVGDAVVHASILPEPFGRVLLEGMAMRKPIIGSRAGAVPEIVVDGVTGRMFTEGDASDLADSLDEVLRDPARAHAMGETGYKRLTVSFSIRANVERTQEVYEAVLGCRPARRAAA